GLVPATPGDDGGDGEVDPTLPPVALPTAGAGGDITITLNNSVGGDVTALSPGGSAAITLNAGATVGGTIDGGSDLRTASTLTFNLETADEAEYDAALATLVPANATGGSITVNGQVYRWSNFSELVNN